MMNTQQSAIFTFSPDGGQHVYAFSPSGKIATLILAGVIGLVMALALALVGLAVVGTSMVTFLLTVSVGSFARLVILLLVVLIAAFVIRYWRASPRSAAFHKIGA